MLLQSSRLLSLLAFLSGPALSQLPIVVDDDAGPGVDFTTLQAAVDAAGPGDSILVKPGVYAGFTIDGKTVRMGVDVPGSVSAVGAVTIANVAQPDWVVLKGFGLGGATTPLSIVDCSGGVQLESCTVVASGIALFESMLAVSIGNCDRVVISDCLISGGEFFSSLQAGGTGLSGFGSSLSIYDSQILGGTTFFEADGSPGAVLAECELYASGSLFQGGAGGPGDDTGNPFQPCTDGGNGGVGLRATATSPATFTLVDCERIGGAGGLAGGATCLDGSSGTSTELTLVSLDEPSGVTAREYDLTFPFIQGVPGEVTYRGEPGDLYWTFYSVGAEARPFPPILGTLALADPLVIVFFGTIPASGEKVIPVTVNLVSGKPFVAIHEQAAFFNLDDGFVFSTPRLAYVTSSGI